MTRDQNTTLGEFTDGAGDDQGDTTPEENAEAIATLLNTVEELNDQVGKLADGLEDTPQTRSIDTQATDYLMFQ